MTISINGHTIRVSLVSTSLHLDNIPPVKSQLHDCRVTYLFLRKKNTVLYAKMCKAMKLREFMKTVQVILDVFDGLRAPELR